VAAANTDVAGLRISLSLDPGMLIEGLIIRWLEALPKRRHPDWVRSLLAQGFLAESRMVQQLRSASAEPSASGRPPRQTARPGLAFGAWLGSSAAAGHRSAQPTDQLRPVPGLSSGTDKPFAHLRKVVG